MRVPAEQRRDVPEFRSSRLAALGSDLALLGGLGVLALLVALALRRSHPVSAGEAFALLTVAAASGSAILLAFTARLGRDPMATRLSSALLVFGLVVLPLTVLEVVDVASPAGQAARIVALVGAAALFALSLRRGGDLGYVWPAAATVTASVLATAALLRLFPALIPPPVALHAVEYAAVLGWMAVAVGLVVSGTRRCSPLLRRVGLGMATVALVYPVGTPALPELLSSVVLLSGVALVLLAVAPFARETVASVAREQQESKARLAAAESAAESAAERDHELRNLVSGLSGAATVLFDHDLTPAEQERLRSAARAELERLQRMLEPDDEPARGTDLHVVLDGLCAMRRAGGAAISADVPAGLRTAVPDEVVAQAAENLLANCARHAPGASVSVRAGQWGSQVVLEVVDGGPGPPPGTLGFLRWRGVGGNGSGHGLGLHITRDLLARYGGAVRLERATPSSGGCRAVLELPAWTEAREVVALDDPVSA